MSQSFTDSIRGVSDFGKSDAQLDYEYAQEMGWVYPYDSGLSRMFVPRSGTEIPAVVDGNLVTDPAFQRWLRTPYYPGAYTPQIPGNPTSALGMDVVRLYLGQIRRYHTHEQIMATPQVAVATLFPEGKALSFKETLAPFFHAIAAVIAYVPGFGTAVAFVLNAATSLAEGAPISEAVLDAVKGALPGQPLSTMAFDMTVAIARGESIENVGIAGLPPPVTDEMKGYFKEAASIVRHLAEGQPVTEAMLDGIYYALPADGQHAMDLARRAANGESVGDLAMEEAAAAVIHAGQAEIDEFVANVGYSKLVDQLPENVRVAIDAANALAYGQQAQEGMPLTTYAEEARRHTAAINVMKAANAFKETASPHTAAIEAIQRSQFDYANLGINPASVRARNDSLASQGKAIASRNSGIRDYRSGFTNLSWLRGFDIGIAAYDGKSTYDDETTSILSSLSGIPEQQDGFLAAQSVQFSITKGTPMPSLGKVLSAARRTQLNDLVARGAQIAAQSPAVRAVRGGSPAFVKGYDAATATCAGNSLPGPGQNQVRWDISQMVVDDRIGTAADAQAGFDLGQQIQHGITKAGTGKEVLSPDPNVAAGQLVVHGISGSTITPDQKAAVVTNAIAGNPGAKAGAAATIAQKKSLWQSFLDFFGL